MTRIRLKTQQGPHAPGSVHEVARVVPHGGHYDCAAQYVLADGTHAPSDCATNALGVVGGLGDVGRSPAPSCYRCERGEHDRCGGPESGCGCAAEGH